MKCGRRQVLHLAAGIFALPVASRRARAQTYPTRPVRFVVGYAAGGGTDTVARLIAQWLSERLGHPFIVENRPGAGTNTATETVVNAPPDGYTILLSSAAGSINASVDTKRKFNFARDLAPIASIVRVPLVLQVHPSLPASTVAEFIAYGKTNPGKISMASPGSGTAPHMAGELFKMMAGINMVNVPYRGEAPALSDLIGGRVHAVFSTVVVAAEQARAGKLRSLGVTTSTPLALLPDIPPIADFLPGYEAAGWFGVSAPKGTPDDIIDVLNKEINSGLTHPRIKAKMDDMGLTILGGSPAGYRKFIADEIDKWAKVVK